MKADHEPIEILVCVKQASDLDTVLNSDWTLNDEGSFDIGYASKGIDDFDETALELAIRFIEQRSGRVQILTVGDHTSERMMRGLCALGAVDPVRIEIEGGRCFTPEQTAAQITEFLEKTKLPDLILMGMQSGEENNAMVPQYLAEILGIPFISNVLEIEDGENGYLHVRRRIEKHIQTIMAKKPFVASVGNIDGVFLRTATLRASLNAKNTPVTVVRLPEVFVNGKMQFVRYLNNSVERQCKMLPANDIAQAASEIARAINEL